MLAENGDGAGKLGRGWERASWNVAAQRAGPGLCSGAPSCGHKSPQDGSVLLDVSSQSGLSFPKPLGPTCPKHWAGRGPRLSATCPIPTRRSLRRRVFWGGGRISAAPFSLPPSSPGWTGLPRPGVVCQAGMKLRPDRLEGEAPAMSSQVALIVSPTPPSLFPVEWV